MIHDRIKNLSAKSNSMELIMVLWDSHILNKGHPLKHGESFRGVPSVYLMALS